MTTTIDAGWSATLSIFSARRWRLCGTRPCATVRLRKPHASSGVSVYS